MSKPALNEMRRHVRLKSGNAEAVPQTLRHGRQAGDSGCHHHRFHIAPSRTSAETPKAQRRELRISLGDPQLEHTVKLAKNLQRQGHLPNDPAPAAL